MFTLHQINDIHDNLGKADTFFEYIQALNEIGVKKYDSYLEDGHSEYFGQDGHRVTSPAVHEDLIVANNSDKDGLIEHLELHDQGKTTYVEMSRGLADCGIEKWTVDTGRATMTFYDCTGKALLVEDIE